MVLAGLLHSAYLYGDFDDAEKRNAPRRRDYVRSLVGQHTEQLINDYTCGKQTPLFDREGRNVQVLYLADLVEELSDAGPLFATKRAIPELPGFPNCESAATQRLLALCDHLVGSVATEMLQTAMDACRDIQVPDSLIRAADRSYKVKPGIDALRRTGVQRHWHRLVHRWNRRRAA
jgi:hypothetical protein